MRDDLPIKVLLVDDDEDDYLITRDLLAAHRGRRYEIEWIYNCDAALAAIQSREHAICLLDYNLGARTGLDLLRDTLNMPSRPPIILLTGQGDHEKDVEAMKAGASDYLVKGQLTSDTLERAMRYAMERKQAEETLRRERDLVGRVMATSPVGIIVTDRQGRITFANQRAEEVLGLAGEDLAANCADLLDWRSTNLDGTPLTEDSQRLRTVLETGRIVHGMHHAREGADKRRVLLSTNATPIFDANGIIDGMVVTVEDITGRTRLEAQFRHSQRMEAIGQLASGVAHDINNILTVIQGHTGLLLFGVTPESDSAKSLKQIMVASDRAARFVNQLLVFSRKQVVRSNVLDLTVMLQNLETMLARLLSKEITLELHHAPALPAIDVDCGLIEQVVVNLAANARDAMPKGGRFAIATAPVQADAGFLRQHPHGREGSFVKLSFTDTGCGMPPEFLEHLFEPFHTTKEIGKGTGLGLATVYGIVKQHRGWIEVASEPGKGTTFQVFLPTSDKPASPVGAMTTPGRAPALTSQGTPLLAVA